MFGPDKSQPVVIEPGQPAKKAVLWMHGLGADGYDFVPIVDQLSPGGGQDVRFVFPHAPEMPVTLNGGMVMPAWYDIVTLDTDSREVDHAGIEKSCRVLYELVLEQGIATEQMVIAGFSQGGVIASALAALIESKGSSIAGLMCLSTYFPFEQYRKISRQTPAFVGHGSQDSVVPMHFGEHCRDSLEAAGYQVEFHSYPMEHSLSTEEIADISRWLEKAFASQ